MGTLWESRASIVALRAIWATGASARGYALSRKALAAVLEAFVLRQRGYWPMGTLWESRASIVALRAIGETGASARRLST